MATTDYDHEKRCCKSIDEQCGKRDALSLVERSGLAKYKNGGCPDRGDEPLYLASTNGKI